jgi:hypothetical protein
VETLIYDSFPKVLRGHVHYHPAVKQHKHMTVDQILAEGRQHIFLYQPEY